MQLSEVLDDCCSFVAGALGALVSRPGREDGFGTFLAAMISLAGGGVLLASATATGNGFDFSQVSRTVEASIARTGASLEVRGTVIARSSNANTVDCLDVPLGIFGEGNPVGLDPAAAAADRLVITYIDQDSYLPDLLYTYSMLGGDGDALLESGEAVVIHVELPAGASLAASERFTLELAAPIGGTVDISRRLPYGLDAVTPLR